MAEKILNTRFQLKYDTLANWTKNNPVLKAGEVGIATIPTNESNSGLTPPAVGIKVGDGTTAFNSLNWIQAIAGDVPAWAKESNHATVTKLINDAIDAIPAAASGAGTTEFTSAKLIKSVTQDEGGKITNVTYEDIAISSVVGLTDRLSGIDTEVGKKLNADVASAAASTSNKLIDTNAAQDMADTAESNATSAAAADATSKVNAAKTALLGADGAEGTHTIKGAYDAAAAVDTKIANLDVTDAGEADKFVYEVDQTDGKIAVTRKSLSEIVGVDGTYNSSTNKLATVSTVTNAVEGLDNELRPLITNMTGAMRFRGTVAAAPTASTAAPDDGLGAWRAGDVVLFGTSEYVVASLNGSSQPVWQLLGDEGAYQTKLAFTSDINAADEKVVTKTTLDGAISSAKAALLGTAAEGTDTIGTVKAAAAAAQTAADNAQDAADAAQADATSALNKIDALDFTDAQATGSGAFVTSVTQTDGKIAVTKKALETADVTGVLAFEGKYDASTNKIATQSTVTNAVDGLSSSVSATAVANNKVSVLTGVTQTNGKLTAKTEETLEAIAKTGNVNDLIQTSGDVLVLFGGDSSTVI